MPKANNQGRPVCMWFDHETVDWLRGEAQRTGRKQNQIVKISLELYRQAFNETEVKPTNPYVRPFATNTPK